MLKLSIILYVCFTDVYLCLRAGNDPNISVASVVSLSIHLLVICLPVCLQGFLCPHPILMYLLRFGFCWVCFHSNSLVGFPCWLLSSPLSFFFLSIWHCCDACETFPCRLWEELSQLHKPEHHSSLPLHPLLSASLLNHILVYTHTHRHAALQAFVYVCVANLHICNHVSV